MSDFRQNETVKEWTPASASEYFNKCIDGVVRLAGDVKIPCPAIKEWELKDCLIQCFKLGIFYL